MNLDQLLDLDPFRLTSQRYLTDVKMISNCRPSRWYFPFEICREPAHPRFGRRTLLMVTYFEWDKSQDLRICEPYGSHDMYCKSRDLMLGHIPIWVIKLCLPKFPFSMNGDIFHFLSWTVVNVSMFPAVLKNWPLMRHTTWFKSFSSLIHWKLI